MFRAMRTMATAVVALAVAMALVAPVSAAAHAEAPGGGGPIVLPAPTGPHPVGRDVLHLVDRDRRDPWVPSGPRELMVSVWYPATAARGARVPYATAEESRLFLDNIEGAEGLPRDSLTRVRTHARAGARALRTRRRLPLVVLSPGFSDPRWMLTTFAEDLASRGYIVAGVDHTYEGVAVTFPDGRVTTCALCTQGWSGAEVVASRTRDLSFVLDRLLAPRSAWRHGRLIDPGRTAIVGHSIGGASAAATMLADPRVDAGINMDGTFFPALDRDLPRPFLMLSTQEHGKHGQNWNDTWSHLTGWRRWLHAPGMVHRSPSDVAFLGEALGRPAQPLSGARSVEIVREYVAAFADQHLRHRHRRLLDRPSQRFPEVEFVGPTTG